MKLGHVVYATEIQAASIVLFPKTYADDDWTRGEMRRENILTQSRSLSPSFLFKQVGVAAWLECWLSHLGVAGSSPGRDNL